MRISWKLLASLATLSACTTEAPTVLATVTSTSAICEGGPCPPTYLPRYFGYYDVIPHWDELDPYSQNLMRVWAKVDTLGGVTTAANQGYHVIVDVDQIFYSGSRLHPDYQARWNSVVSTLALVREGAIVAFEPGDERYDILHGNNGVPVADVKADLEEIARTIKTDFPTVAMYMNFGAPVVTQGMANAPIPTGFDWFGVNCYGPWDACRSDVGMPSLLAWLKAASRAANPSARLVIVGDGEVGCPHNGVGGGSDQLTSVRAGADIQYARSDQAVVAVLVWGWDEAGAGCSGVRYLTETRNTWYNFGAEVVARYP